MDAFSLVAFKGEANQFQWCGKSVDTVISLYQKLLRNCHSFQEYLHVLPELYRIQTRIFNVSDSESQELPVNKMKTEYEQQICSKAEGRQHMKSTSICKEEIATYTRKQNINSKGINVFSSIICFFLFFLFP